MSRLKFDIKFRPQIESGEYKVVTGDGRPVKIVCWDKKAFRGRFEIVGLVSTSQGDAETVQLYYQDGTLIASYWNENYKLFIVTPEPELSEFEEEVRVCVRKNLTTCIKDGNGREIMSSTIFIDDDTAKKMAAELLELARKELEPEVLERLEVAYKNQDEVVYENGKRDGKAEALKDLPRWRKCVDCTPKPKYSNEWIFSIDSENVTRESAIVHKGYFLPLDGLERLPGFNE